MSKKLAQMVVCAVLFLTACTSGRGGAMVSTQERGSNPREGVQPMVDKDYLIALNTADRFLNAWLLRDWQSGPQYLTPELKSQAGPDAVQMFFSGLSNPHHQGFEIVGLERPANDEIRFNLWLYDDYSDSDATPQLRPNPLTLSLVKTRDGAWLVSRLPGQ